MAQILGRKRLKLISPLHLPVLYDQLHCFSEVDLDQIDVERYPLFRQVKIHEVTLNPGECLFLPIGWWHHVRALDVSITLSGTNFWARNDFFTTYDTHGLI